jgi:hypothetical protein
LTIINKYKKSLSILLCIIYSITQIWISELMLLHIPKPIYDGAQYVTAAYNMAKYNVSSVSTLDAPNVTPDLVREPITSFLISLPMRIIKIDN